MASHDLAHALDGRRVGIALSGGGAHGAFEAGVVAELEAAGVAFDVLAGTSAGALNAAAMAVGLSGDELVDLWTSMQSRDVYRLRTDLHRLVDARRALDPRRWARTLRSRATLTDQALDAIGWSWLLDTTPLRDLLATALGGEQLPIEDGKVLTVPSVDLTTGRLVRFTNARPSPQRQRDDTIVGPLTVDHLLSSAAIPLLFRPHRVDGELHWDGGLVANTPLRAALQHEPDVCVVVASGAVRHDAAEPRSLGRAAALVVDHVLRYALIEDLDHARTVNELVRHAPDATKHKWVDFVPVVRDEPTDGGLGELLDFEPERARRQVERGRERAREALEELARVA